MFRGYVFCPLRQWHIWTLAVITNQTIAYSTIFGGCLLLVWRGQGLLKFYTNTGSPTNCPVSLVPRLSYLGFVRMVMRTLVSISDNHCKGSSNESMTMPHMRSLDQLKPLPAGWLGQQRVGQWFLPWAAQKSCPSHFGHGVHGGGSAGLTGGLAAGPSQQEHVWPSR